MTWILPLSALMIAIQPAVLPAASMFDGTWVADIDSVKFPAATDHMLLKDGTFLLETHGQRFETIADGRFHPIDGGGYIDESAITVVDAVTIDQVDRLKGRVVYRTTHRLSADGATLNSASILTPIAGQPPRQSEAIRARTEAGPPGAHAISGRWRPVGLKASAQSTTMTLRLANGKLSRSTSGGESYEAVVGGAPVLIEGDNAGGMATVEMPDAETIIERDSLNGVVGGELILKMLDDRKHIRATGRNPRNGDETVWIYEKLD